MTTRRSTRFHGKAGRTPGAVLRPTPASNANASGAAASRESTQEIKPENEMVGTASGRFIARGSSGSRLRKSAVHLESAEGSVRHSGGDGAGIGNLHRRGWSLTMKISVFTLLIIVLITCLFGFVAIRIMRSELQDEILRLGQQQALTLSPLSRNVLVTARIEMLQAALADYAGSPKVTAAITEMIDALRNGEDAGKVLAGVPAPERSTVKSIYDRLAGEGLSDADRRRVEDYKKTHPGDMLELDRIVKGDALRVKDVVIFTSWFPETVPLLRATASKEFATTGDTAKFDERPSKIKIYWARYDNQRCLYFRLPIHELRAVEPAKPMGEVNLILSASAIDDKVSGLIRWLMFFGLFFMAAGLAIARVMASRISKPINVLVDDVNTVAQGDLEHQSTVPSVTKDEIGLLAMAFNRMTKNLRDAQATEREAQRLSSEVNLAKSIHANLIPKKLPNLPGLDIDSAYDCAKEVGGDYYDFIPVGDAEHLGFCVADVSGKGIPGSMVMGTTRTYLRMMAVNNYSAADVLAKTNSWVVRDMKRGMFVTCVYAILNLRTREMVVASAGHNPMYIWRAATQAIEKLRPNGIALGFDKGPIFNRTIREEKIVLHEGDRVLMYTDGVVESMNDRHEEWGDEQLEKFMLEHATQSSKDFIRLLMKALREHQGRAEQHDDITIVTFRVG